MVERPGSDGPGFEAAGFAGGGAGTGFAAGGAAAGDWPNTIVAPGSGAAPAFAAGGFVAGGWPKTMVPVGDGSGPFLGAGGGGRLPVWNIIVRPGASPAGASGFAGVGLPCAGTGWDAGRGGALATAGAANMAVAWTSGALFGAGAAGFAGAGGCGSGAAAGGRITLKVFWHFPQRMVSPCGPIRASSTRYRAWHLSQRTSIDASPGGTVTYRIRAVSL
jgi:hypothetical protein